MKAFAELYRRLDETTRTTQKVAAMRDYFQHCAPEDGAWGVYFLSGRRFKRLIPTGTLRRWSAELAGIPDWLFDECYSSVGDLAETIALLLPQGSTGSEEPLHHWVETRLQPLAGMTEEEQKASLEESWGRLTPRERLVFNKLATGSFRVGVSQRLVVRALAEATDRDAATIAHHLMGDWTPTPHFYRSLFATDAGEVNISRPYPFCLAHPLQGTPESLGDLSDWMLEWKWDGIRAQAIRREGETFLWSRGEEMILDRFPDLAEALAALPDGTVLDGEIVAWKEGQVQPFFQLQRRIGRKNVSKRMLSEIPARMLVFDLLERGGEDVRETPLHQRREWLDELLQDQPADARLMASPLIQAENWEACVELRSGSRERGVEGFMLKRRDSPYAVGRPTGLWWKWKVDPYTCDAVLVYAQRGSGRRASLYTDYTFAVWDDGELTPFAKAYSGLTDEEIRQVDRFVRGNTLEKFGPVRAVKPELVFELAFESIQPSNRHKSGIAVRFPRMARWRHDKRPEDADTLENVRGLMQRDQET